MKQFWQKLSIVCVSFVLFVLSGCAIQPTDPSPNVTLAQPNMSDQMVVEWASRIAMHIQNYNAYTYRHKIASSAQYFTPYGWRVYLRAMKKSPNMRLAIQQEDNVSAQLSGEPKVVQHTEVDHCYAWIVEVPMQVRYEGKHGAHVSHETITMTITRVSREISREGIAISKIAF